MSLEIEKKFLLRENDVNYLTDFTKKTYGPIDILMSAIIEKGKCISQGYMQIEQGKVLASQLGINYDFQPKEARLRKKEKSFYFTLKGEGFLTRNEEEVEITEDIFEQNWPATKGKRVSKIRLEVPYGDLKIEFDLYRDRDLMIAEVEVPKEIQFIKISNLGKDVTEDPKYKNINLAK